MANLTRRMLAGIFALVLENAHAALIDHGNYFTDTETSLDWLMNAPLAGQSYNAVLSGYGGYLTSGWRFASGEELNALVSEQVGQLGPLNSSNGWTSDDFSPRAFSSAYNLIELLGVNGSFGNPPDPRAGVQIYSTDLTGLVTQGWYDDGNGSELVGIFALMAYDQPLLSATPYSKTQIIPDFLGPNERRGLAVSSILVRAAVPEPATLVLVGLGLAGLGYSRRK